MVEYIEPKNYFPVPNSVYVSGLLLYQHEEITDIILVSVTDSILLSNGQWQLSKEDDYSKYGLLLFDINTELSDNLIVRLFLIDELTLSWSINQQ